MTQTLALKDRELFWPPADELTEAAERIRARLGDWPPTHAPQTPFGVVNTLYTRSHPSHRGWSR